MTTERTSEARIKTVALAKEATESANRILAASEVLLLKTRAMLNGDVTRTPPSVASTKR